MEWKLGKRETGLRCAGSGPYELGLLKKTAAEAGNHFFYFLNDQWVEKEKGW